MKKLREIVLPVLLEEILHTAWLKKGLKKIVKLRKLIVRALIRIEESVDSNGDITGKSCMVANQLRLMEKKKGQLQNFYDDKRSVELGEVISNSEDGDTCLFQFNNSLISLKFIPEPLEKLLDDYELSYAPNYLF